MSYIVEQKAWNFSSDGVGLRPIANLLVKMVLTVSKRIEEILEVLMKSIRQPLRIKGIFPYAVCE